MSEIDVEQKMFARHSNLSENLETINLNNLDKPESFFLNTKDILKNIRYTENFDYQSKNIMLPISNNHIFSHTVTSINKNILIDFCIDSCSKIFLLEHATTNTQNWIIRSILDNGDLIDVSDEVASIPRKIVCSSQFVFVLERFNDSDVVSAYSKDYLELKFQIFDLDENVVDIDVDSNGNIVVLGTKIQKILLSEGPSLFLKKISYNIDEDFTQTKFLSVDHNDNLFLLSPSVGRLIIFQTNESGNFEKTSLTLPIQQYHSFEVFDYENIFLCCSKNHILQEPQKYQIHENKLSLINFDVAQPTQKIKSNPLKDLLVLTEPKQPSSPIIQQLNKFNFNKTFKSNSKISLVPLDSTHKGTEWHKMILNLDLPSKKTSTIISYGASDVVGCSDCNKTFDDVALLKKHFTNTHNPKFSNGNIVPPFEQFDDLLPNPKNALLNCNGRFLWLIIRLMTLDGDNTPTLNSMRIYFPRTSYLRYLPNIYGHDINSKNFLEKFLSIFEFFFDDMDKKIFNFHTFLDPKTTPIEFLPWLSKMLGVTYDDQWPEQNFRKMLSSLPILYKKRGTRDGLRELLLLFLSSADSEIPQKKNEHSIMIFENFQLNCMKKNLHTRNDEYYALYGTDPNAFSVLIDSSLLDSKKLDMVRKIVDNEKPAHTIANICPLADWFYLGSHTYLGLNTVLGDQSFVVGTSALSRDTMIQ